MTFLLKYLIFSLQNAIKLLLCLRILFLFLGQFYAVLPAVFENSTDQLFMLFISLFFHKSILASFFSNDDMYLCMLLYVHFLESFLQSQEPSTLYYPRTFHVQLLLFIAQAFLEKVANSFLLVDSQRGEAWVDFEEISRLWLMEDYINGDLLKHISFVFDMEDSKIRDAYQLTWSQLPSFVIDDL